MQINALKFMKKQISQNFTFSTEDGQLHGKCHSHENVN